jgi:hypothetical protein
MITLQPLKAAISWARSVGRRVLQLFGKAPVEPHWEVVVDPDGVMCHVRWSERFPNGKYLYVRHYPAGAWGETACASNARAFNEQKRHWTDFSYQHFR